MVNEVDYRDPTPNNFPDDYDPAKVDQRVKLRSESIRYKQKGVDVREAMYQGLEIGSATANEAKVISENTAESQDNLTQRVDDQIAANTIKDEEIDFRRSDMLKKTFETMRKRGDFFDDEFAGRMLNVKWFGAKGDGATDDTDAIKAAVEFAFSKGKEGELSVYFPTGRYITTSAIELKAVNNQDDYYKGHGVKLVGHDKATTEIIKRGKSAGDFVDAVITLIGYVTETGEQAKTGTGIQIKNLSIINESEDKDSYAVYGKAFQRGLMEDLNITAVNGVYLKDPYTSRYISVFLNTVESGIYIDGGTSNYLEACYGRTGKNPFKISSAYSVLTNCFTGDCTGTMFDFPEASSIVMVGCGDESVTSQYKIGITTGVLTVDGYSMNYTGGDLANGITLDKCAVINIKGNAVVNMDGLQVGFVSSVVVDQDSYLLMFESAANSASANIGSIRYTTSDGWGGTPGGNVHRLIYSNMSTAPKGAGHIQTKGVDILTRRNHQQPYLGNRGLKDTMNNAFFQKAIYLDNISTTQTSSADVSQEEGYNQGDVLLYNNPSGRGALGAVATNTAATVAQNTFKSIPLTNYGPTDQRPRLISGQEGTMYFDTGLNKPIWWIGVRWVDANGVSS
ncbi:glycosyl hydrolase family 28-related protein [Latilactobacillus sakei]|uniref:glycosyl hydrolase family 28-related protein n=1 Tax=Latilactobacillus sakei TaxID=1599 RepID=UPI003F534B70